MLLTHCSTVCLVRIQLGIHGRLLWGVLTHSDVVVILLDSLLQKGVYL